MTEDNPYAPPISDLIFIDTIAEAARWRTAGVDLRPRYRLDHRHGFRFPSHVRSGGLELCEQGANRSLLRSSPLQAFLVFSGSWWCMATCSKRTVRPSVRNSRAYAFLTSRVMFPDFAKVILLRYLPISLVSLIPFVGPYLSLSM